MARIHLSYSQYASLVDDNGVTYWVKFNWLNDLGYQTIGYGTDFTWYYGYPEEGNAESPTGNVGTHCVPIFLEQGTYIFYAPTQTASFANVKMYDSVQDYIDRNPTTWDSGGLVPVNKYVKFTTPRDGYVSIGPRGSNTIPNKNFQLWKIS